MIRKNQKKKRVLNDRELEDIVRNWNWENSDNEMLSSDSDDENEDNDEDEGNTRTHEYMLCSVQWLSGQYLIITIFLLVDVTNSSSKDRSDETSPELRAVHARSQLVLPKTCKRSLSSTLPNFSNVKDAPRLSSLFARTE